MAARVIVTGASGHVGAALVRALLAEGHGVRAFVRRDVRALEGLAVELCRVDVTNRRQVAESLVDAEVVYHAAARLSLESGSDAAAEEVNVTGTRNVVDACRTAGVRRLVHFSTAHALDASGGLLEAERGLPYERSKALAEREVLAAAHAGLDAVIVSPCAVIGPYDHKPSYMGRVLLLVARRLLPATIGGGQSWVDVRDVAQAAMAAARVGERGGRYVVGGHWHSFAELARMASAAAGVRPPPFRVSRGLARAFAPVAERMARFVGREPLLSRASLDALEEAPRVYDGRSERDLGYAPRALGRTLGDTFQWYTERGWLAPRRSA